MDRVGLAIVGCGNITEHRHLPAIATEVPELALVALCNRSEGALHRLGDEYRVPMASRYTDYRNLLDRDDIQAILVAASPAANSEITQQAARAHKHLFVEKPMADTADQARVMLELVQQSGIKFQVGFNKRYYYAYREAKTLVGNGSIGDLSGIGARFWFKRSSLTPSKRMLSAQQQVVFQNGIHFLDLLQFFAGPACEVAAYEKTVKDSDAGDRATISATITFDGGAVGSLLLSSCASWSYPSERLDITGSNGCCLAADNGRRLSLFREDQPGLQYEETISGHWLTGHKEAGFTLQLKAFARSILQDSPVEVGPTDGLRSLLLAEAVEKSLKTHRSAIVSRV